MESQSSLLVADQSRQEGKWACWAGKAQKLLPASPDWSHTPRASWRSWRSSLSHGSWKRDSPSQHFRGRQFHNSLGPGAALHSAHPLCFPGVVLSPDLTVENFPIFRVKEKWAQSGSLCCMYRSQTFSPASIGSWGPLKICWVPLDFFPRKKNQPNI